MKFLRSQKNAGRLLFNENSSRRVITHRLTFIKSLKQTVVTQKEMHQLKKIKNI